MTDDRPSAIVHVSQNWTLTDDEAAELKTRFLEAARTQSARIMPTAPRNWVLVNGWHDSSKTEAVYGPYTREQAEWLMGGPLDGSCENWTLAEMQTWPPGTPE